MPQIPQDTPLDRALPPPATSTSQEESTPGAINKLGSPHFESLEMALRRVLSTDVAEFTYAQIIDGLLTEDSLHEFQTPRAGNPVIVLGLREFCVGNAGEGTEFHRRL